MSVFKNQINVAEYEYDFDVDGGATGVYVLSDKANKESLPFGAVVKEVKVIGQTPLAGSGASAKVGHAGNDALYKAQVTATLYNASACFSYDTAFQAKGNNRDVRLTIAGAALTAGKLKVLVEYILPNS
jgi:hypothetical protein